MSSTTPSPALAASSASPTASLPWRRWLFPFALAAMIIVASGRGQVAAPSVINFDKAAHFFVFGLLATLVVRSPGGAPGWRAVLIVSLFGTLDELRQSFTPGRAVEFADWIADTAGGLTAVLAYVYWSAYRRILEYSLFGRARPAAYLSKSAPDEEPEGSPAKLPV